MSVVLPEDVTGMNHEQLLALLVFVVGTQVSPDVALFSFPMLKAQEILQHHKVDIPSVEVAWLESEEKFELKAEYHHPTVEPPTIDAGGES